MRTLNIIFLLLLACTVQSSDAAVSKAAADTLYSQHHYVEAAEAYTKLLKSHPRNSQLLYNLGNCYYRLRDMPHAILAYERAAKINPSDGDCRHNLTLARAQTQDKFYSSSDLDIAWSFNSFVNTFGAAGWAWLSAVALGVMLTAILLMRFSNVRWIKKTTFAVILLAAVCIILFIIFAIIQRSKHADHSSAIIMNTTKLMSTPDTTGTNLFTLHGGTKVSLRDTTLPTWSEVSLSDGQKGWINNDDMEKI